MEFFSAGLPLWTFAMVLAITFFAGFVKGAVGFAMPLIMISAFSSFLSPDLALAGLILPTLITNISQAFRNGWRVAWQAAKDYHRYLIGTVVFIILSSPFVHLIPQYILRGALGVLITGFALLQLTGVKLSLPLNYRAAAEWIGGIIGGLYGGVSGIWGPPLIVYLLAIDAPKKETVQVQGVVFLIGAVVLTSAHLQSGLLNAVTVPFSAALVVPAFIGLGLGYLVQDRLDQKRFRRWTQVLLLLTGLNLSRLAFGL